MQRDLNDLLDLDSGVSRILFWGGGGGGFKIFLEK